MSVYTSLFISLCFNACVSLYSLVSLILVYQVAWLVLLFEFFSDSNGNGFGLSVRVKMLTHGRKMILVDEMYIYTRNCNSKLFIV